MNTMKNLAALWIASALVLMPVLGTAQSKPVIDPSDGISAEFRLLNKDGEMVSVEDFLGHYVLIGFGFTNCPHVCPMMAATMGRVLKSTDKDAVGIFVSVDTERDTPAHTHTYASSYDDRMLGLGGDYNLVAQAAKNFKVTYSVSKSANTYTVQHTSNTYLLGPDGKLISIFALNSTPAEILAAIDQE
jgi:cytochrome oxidase Cu insertion factor (SCO1/SenC/PrrC family)